MLKRFSGILSILNLIARPMPAVREWLRMEGQVGRYFHHNLLCVGWIDVASRFLQDDSNAMQQFIEDEILTAPIHTLAL